MVVFDALTQILIEVQNRVVKVLELVYMVIKDFIKFITANFEFDKPHKTLALSILIFFSVYLLLSYFSVTHIPSDGAMINLGDGIVGQDMLGDETQNAGNDTRNGEPDPVVPVGFCQSDQDCEYISEGELIQPKCCIPEEFEGLRCAGRCLNDETLTNSACFMPNACAKTNNDKLWIEQNYTSCVNRQYIETITGRSYNDAIADEYCRNRGADTIGYQENGGCCNSALSPCYGMCLKDITGNKEETCWNPNNCYGQSTIIVQAISSNYI